MMSSAVIREMSQQAAKAAAKARKVPFMVWPEDVAAIKAGYHMGVISCFPFIGDYRPRGYKLVDTLFVDSTGFGDQYEPALTLYAFGRTIEANFAYAIIEAGQFQVYVGKFKKMGERT